MNKKIYQKSWFMWLMLIFVTPVGVFLLWKNSGFSSKAKMALSVAFSIWFVFMFITTQSDSNKTDNMAINNETAIENEQLEEETAEEETAEEAVEEPEPIKEEPVEMIDYEVVNKEDVSFSTTKRINYRIVVSEEATDDQLKLILSELDTKKYDEVTIWFFKDKSEIENYMPYTVAMLEKINDEIKISRR
jgi:hypothetical protein